MSSDDPKAPSTKPPPAGFADTSASEQLIASAARATTAMRAMPPLKAHPRVIMDPDEIGWIDLSGSARALLPRLDGSKSVLDLAEGSDAQVEAVFDALNELERALVIAYDT